MTAGCNIVPFDRAKAATRHVSDYEVAARMREPLEDLRRGTERRVRPERPESPKTATTIQPGPAEPEPSSRGEPLPDEEARSYLLSAHGTPYATVTQLQEREGLSAYGANRLRKRLVDTGMMVSFTVNVGRATGGTVTLTALTEAGCRAIGKPTPLKPLPNTSQEHWWWQRAICAFYRRHGYDARVEFNLEGKLCDVGFPTATGLVAIEVELTPKNAVRNVVEDLERGASRVVAACRNAKVRQAVEARRKQALGDHGMARVKLMLLSEFSFVKEMFGRDGRGTTDKAAAAGEGP